MGTSYKERFKKNLTFFHVIIAWDQEDVVKQRAEQMDQLSDYNKWYQNKTIQCRTREYYKS